MGNTCSGLRRSRTRTKDVGQSAPPPYEPGKRTTVSSDQLQKEDPPELSAHPALRNMVMLNYISTTSRRTTIDSSASTLVAPSEDVHIPPQAHLATRSQAQTSPPASTPERRHSGITASTTPLWRWTNTQCKSWIAAVLIEYAGKSTEQANELASEFQGWGPNLYMKGWKQWNSWLGQDGQAIFALLVEVHGEEGAVPLTVEIAHYALEDRKRAEKEKEKMSRREGASIKKGQRRTEGVGSRVDVG